MGRGFSSVFTCSTDKLPIDGKFGKKTYFVINFDDSIQDFLSNAQENEK